MSLRRGFKASANRISIRLRRGQGLPAHAPIDLAVVVARLQIEIVPLSLFEVEFPKAVRQLVHLDDGAFSATTLPWVIQSPSLSITTRITATASATTSLTKSRMCCWRIRSRCRLMLRAAAMSTATSRKRPAGRVPRSSSAIAAVHIVRKPSTPKPPARCTAVSQALLHAINRAAP